jgi:hypothetical protein
VGHTVGVQFRHSVYIRTLSLWMKVLAKLGNSDYELNDVSLGLRRLHYNSYLNRFIINDSCSII